MSGGAGSPFEGKQKAFVPPPAGRAGRVPRESFRGKSCFPLAGFASRGRIIPPLRETRRPPLGCSLRLRPSRRAPRGSAGGGFPGFADSTTWDRSARFPELSVTRFARVPRNLLPRYNPRALLEIKDSRFPLHKHPISTYPFPLTPAFLQPSASGKRNDSPRPCLKKQGRRGGAFPWGGYSLPEGRTFSGYFSVRSEK